MMRNAWMVAAVVLTLQTSNGYGSGFDLRWDNCGSSGTYNKNFACNVNTSSDVLVLSFVAPGGITRFNGLTGSIEIVAETALPDWWNFSTGGCRSVGGLIVSADFTAGPFDCLDIFQGGAFGVSTMTYLAPNRLRVAFTFAVPSGSPLIGPIPEYAECFAVKFQISHAKTVGTNSCNGCSMPVCIFVNYLKLFQEPGTPGGDQCILGPLGQDHATWQGGYAGCRPPGESFSYYRDMDGDGYGNPAVSSCGLTPPSGYVTSNADCDDSDPAVHPGAAETVCNGIDDNCSGRADETTGSVAFAVAPLFGSGHGPYAVAIADLNQPLDGNLDLVAANYDGHSVSVLLGNGDGTFGPKTDYVAGTASVAVGDLSGDGKLDLAVADFGFNRVAVLRGNGAGGFGSPAYFTTGSGPFSVAIGNFNADAFPDLATANYGSNNVSILLGFAGGFGAKTDFPAGQQAQGVAVGQLNADANLDLAVANLGSDNLTVLFGNGSGGFPTSASFAVGDQPYGPPAIADVNADGKSDLVAQNFGSSTVSVLLGNGAGNFSPAPGNPFATGPNPVGVAIGDLTGDGKRDLAVANFGSHTVSVMPGDNTGSFPTHTEYVVGHAPGLVAIGDVNNDGQLDLAVGNRDDRAVSVLLNNTNPGFAAVTELPTGLGAYGVAQGDVNGDGKADLAVADFTANTVSVTLGLGGGRFGPRMPFNTGAGPISVAIGDMTGDGQADLVVANYASNNVSVLAGNGGGSFSSVAGSPFAVGTAPFCVAIGDLNLDGRRDLAVANYESGSISLLLGAPGGGFTTPPPILVGSNPISVAIGDIYVDGNGYPDLAVANNSSNTWAMLPGDGTGGFPEVPDAHATGANPYSVGIRDLNGDGVADVVVTTYTDNTVSVFLNHRTSFAPRVDYPTGVHPRVLAIGDLSGDGSLDLVAVNHDDNTGTVTVLPGNGNGTFSTRTDFCVGSGPRGLALGDLSGDGRLDLAVASEYTSTVSVMLNAGTFPVTAVEPEGATRTRFTLLAPRPNPARGTVE